MTDGVRLGMKAMNELSASVFKKTSQLKWECGILRERPPAVAGHTLEILWDVCLPRRAAIGTFTPSLQKNDIIFFFFIFDSL